MGYKIFQTSVFFAFLVLLQNYKVDFDGKTIQYYGM